jgi:hypothetical protein
VTGHKWADMQGGVTTTIDQRAGDAWAHDTTVNGNQSSTINGHAHSFISGGQDNTVHSGQTVTITGGKTSTVVGVNFSGTAPLNVSADVLKLSMAVASVNIAVASMSTFDVHAGFGIFTITQTMFQVKNTGSVHLHLAPANIFTCGLYSVL